MPRYLVQASYTVDGLKGILKKGGSSRKAAVEQMIQGMGGTMETFYFAFGGDDVVAIADLPDDASMTAVSLGVIASGAITGFKTTVLITPETVDEATKKTVSYRPPGQ